MAEQSVQRSTRRVGVMSIFHFINSSQQPLSAIKLMIYYTVVDRTRLCRFAAKGERGSVKGEMEKIPVVPLCVLILSVVGGAEHLFVVGGKILVSCLSLSFKHSIPFGFLRLPLPIT